MSNDYENLQCAAAEIVKAIDAAAIAIVAGQLLASDGLEMATTQRAAEAIQTAKQILADASR